MAPARQATGQAAYGPGRPWVRQATGQASHRATGQGQAAMGQAGHMPVREQVRLGTGHMPGGPQSRWATGQVVRAGHTYRKLL